MEIKPTGPGGVPFTRADKSVDRGPRRPFSGAAPDSSVPDPVRPGLDALGGASKADLQNSEAAEALVHRCLDELVEAAGRQLNRPISEQDRRYLSDWLAADPVMRNKLRGYLEQVLK